MGSPELIKLDAAAHQLGCHVETLRERVREGRLAATRGPHGAYLVSREALTALPRHKRGRPRASHVPSTKAREEGSWILLGVILARQSDDIAPETRLLEILQAEPWRARDLYNLVSVHRLRAVGQSKFQISIRLGLSERHVRRLAAKPLWLTLRTELIVRLIRSDGRRARARARELIAIVRERLQAEGVPAHPRRFKHHKISAHQERMLSDAGLTAEEIEAIRLEGLSVDELNALLVRGSRPASPVTVPLTQGVIPVPHARG